MSKDNNIEALLLETLKEIRELKAQIGDIHAISKPSIQKKTRAQTRKEKEDNIRARYLASRMN